MGAWKQKRRTTVKAVKGFIMASSIAKENSSQEVVMRWWVLVQYNTMGVGVGGDGGEVSH